jgi:DNA-binding HxlR family transcriptional regulator
LKVTIMAGVSKQTIDELALGCRLNELLKFLAKEWTTHIVWALGRQERIRFGALRKALPGDVSARVLSARLKELSSLGLVERIDARTFPLNVEYRLTEAGRRLDVALLENEAAAARLALPEPLLPKKIT